MSIQSITQSIVDTKYGWAQPGSLIVLVPIMSLIFQKIQVAHIQETLSGYPVEQMESLRQSLEFKKLDTIYAWHTLGSLIQTIVLLALSRIYPLFLIPASCAIYELCCSFVKLNTRELNWDESHGWTIF